MSEKFDVKDAFGVIVEIVQFIMLAVGIKEVSDAKPGEERKEAVKQHLPHLFGLGRADEGIWGSVRTGLKKDERSALDKIMQKLTLDESTSLLLNIGSMPNETTTNEKGEKINVVEFSENDRRVKFLKDLVADANMCQEDDDIRHAVETLRINHLVDESKLSEIHKEVKQIIVKSLCLDSVNDLSDPNKVAKAINDVLVPHITAYRKKHYKVNPFYRFVGWVFQI
ncbi:MAG: hypothetical protein A2937_00745 [Candidatus Yonathbacteria bacterium RIFCSPLOWO2_01_FULL_47_33b]|uniref:Uncharacterized protein n=1 Tax=Candidatus Yonathbacteria bacterium RIFCSPLOWO2_01_FULL_47_33b TaxID=1802727 RepID=A0A1G2SEE9_9BACT|nr:MAG: hypothetical protein A2937_00745 [Candidatus Yonathbacteria bacterium RIFCSPLOWO2_01_FULL_47_33b]